MASTGVGSSGADGASAKRSLKDGWWPSRPSAISGAIPAAWQASTLAALK
jgi:hypothetical protein